MIAFIEGEVRMIRTDSVVIDTGGVGWEIFTPNPYAVPKGQPLFLYTYQHFGQDSQTLYGFVREADYEVFLRLLNVKGIGPRTALNILRASSGTSIIENIEQGNVQALKALPGIGAKTASQIVLDLQGKLVRVLDNKEIKESDPVWDETASALESLGYRPADIKDLRKELAGKGLDVSDMLRQALILLAKRKGV